MSGVTLPHVNDLEGIDKSKLGFDLLHLSNWSKRQDESTIYRVPFLSSPGPYRAYWNIASGDAELDDDFRTYISLRGSMAQFRLMTNIYSTTATGSEYIYVAYHNGSSFVDLSATAGAADLSITATGVAKTSWCNIAVPATDNEDLQLTIYTYTGGTRTVYFNSIVAEFRL